MVDYFLVEIEQGPAWEQGQPRRRQSGWDEHATFMDALVDEGVVVLGGPVGEGVGDHVLLVVDAADEAAVRACLADDPWQGTRLKIRSVKPWSVWLRPPED